MNIYAEKFCDILTVSLLSSVTVQCSPCISQHGVRGPGRCFGFSEDVPHRLGYLNTWPSGGAAWEGLGGVTLLKYVIRGGL